MACRLADEVLKDILASFLVVPDELFADNGAVSPFSRVTQSASDVLLICKRWMRIGTPVLFTTVVVRSMPQARALALAMTNNPEFGRHTRKLRIEGAYGGYILTAVRQMPNIRDLCMTVGINSNISINGTLDALEMMNPERVILTLAPPRTHKCLNRHILLETLAEQICTWPRLKTFVFAGSQTTHLRGYSPEADYHQYQKVFNALAEASALVDVHFTMFKGHEWALWRCLKSILEKKSRLVARIQGAIPVLMSAQVNMRTRLPPELHARVLFESGEPCATVPMDIQHNPFYKPFSGVSTGARQKLLSLIISFALAPSTLEPDALWLQDTLWYNMNQFNRETISALLETSFEIQDLVLKQLVEHISFSSQPAVVEELAKMVSNSPSLGAKARTLQTHAFPTGVNSPIAPDVQTHARVIKLLPELREAAIVCAQDILQALYISGSASTLRKLALWGGGLFAPAMFNMAAFTALEHLELDTTSVSLELDSWKGRTRSLPLRNLVVWSSASALFDGLAKFELPNWTSLTTHMYNHELMKGLLTKRGRTLHTVRLLTIDPWLWKLLPSLEVLELDNPGSHAEPPVNALSKARHKNLRVLKFNTAVLFKPGIGIHHELWERLLCHSITRARFPALKEIHLLQPVNLWPTTEREITKNMWPVIAEYLEEHGIRLLNFEGRQWRKRLQ